METKKYKLGSFLFSGRPRNLVDSQTDEKNLKTQDIYQNKIDELVLNLTNSIIEAPSQ